MNNITIEINYLSWWGYFK